MRMVKREERMEAITAETVLAFGPAASIQPVGDVLGVAADLVEERILVVVG
jgi:hypothetical protein